MYSIVSLCSESDREKLSCPVRVCPDRTGQDTISARTDSDRTDSNVAAKALQGVFRIHTFQRKTYPTTSYVAQDTDMCPFSVSEITVSLSLLPLLGKSEQFEGIWHSGQKTDRTGQKRTVSDRNSVRSFRTGQERTEFGKRSARETMVYSLPYFLNATSRPVICVVSRISRKTLIRLIALDQQNLTSEMGRYLFLYSLCVLNVLCH